MYPRRLVSWISQAILVDAGLLPERFRLDVSAVARQSHSRVGEAGNPGPRRRGPLHRRDISALHSVQLVEPVTAALGERVWQQFAQWCLRHLTEEEFVALSSHPLLLNHMIEAFGGFLFESGHSLYLLRHLITYVQREKPHFSRTVIRSLDLGE